MRIKLQTNPKPSPKPWTPVEVLFLLKYYPKYLDGSIHYTAPWLRGHLKSRTMAAISKKYWTFMGATGKKKGFEEKNQVLMDFVQDKIQFNGSVNQNIPT